MFTGESLQIGYLSRAQMASIASNLLNINVSYSMDMANQLSFSVIDPGFVMGVNNYFQVGVDVVYETTSIDKIRVLGDDSPIVTRIRHIYEISQVSVSQQNSSSPIWSVEAMPKAVQQMKRDKKPEAISGSGYSYVQKAARRYGLQFVGEKSSRIKHSSKNSGDGQSDSVWNVIKSIADESQYMLFVQDGVLYFGTQEWLLYRWGTEVLKGKQKKDKKGKPIINPKTKKPELYPNKYYIPMDYVGYTANPSAFEVMSLPQISRNENDPMEASGSLQVSRQNGVQLRPGMTIRIKNIPNMSGYYLITAVNFSEQTTDPVGVEFRTPERLRKEDGKEPDIPQLPVGQIFESQYKIQRPIYGASAIGEVTRAEILPTGAIPGTTLSPDGQLSMVKLPNSRRPDYYPHVLNFVNSNAIRKLVPGGVSLQEALNAIADMVEFGNIDIYNRPLYIQNNIGGKQIITISTHIFYDAENNVYVIGEMLSCADGAPLLGSPEDAESLYYNSALHHGIFESQLGAKFYNNILYAIQDEVLKKRFPKSYKKIVKGQVDDAIAVNIGRCSIG